MQTLMNKTLFVVLIGFSLVSGSVANAYSYQPYPQQQPYYGQSGTLYRTTHTRTTTYYGYPGYGGYGGGYGYPGSNPYGGGCGYGMYGGTCGAYPYPQYVYGGGCFYGVCGGGYYNGGYGYGYPKSSWGFFVNIGGIGFGGGGTQYY